MRRRSPFTSAAALAVLAGCASPSSDRPAMISGTSQTGPYRGFTGDLATIVSVARNMGVAIDDAQKLPSGGYEVTHGTQVIGFGKDHKAVVVWMYPTSVGDLRADFETLARA